MNISKIFNLMTRRGLYFTQGAFGLEIIFILRNQTKGWRRIHNRLYFPLQVVKFAIDELCITHNPKEIKKKNPFQNERELRVLRYYP